MADVNANIGVNIDASDALAQLKQLQRQISQFHSSIQKSSEAAALAQRNLTKNFMNSVNAIEGFSAELKTVRTTAESFTNSLEKNKFSLREYFRYAGASTKTFGKVFTNEFNTIEKVAVERVKTLQTQYVKLGRDASGAMQSIAIRPTILDMQDLGTQAQIAAQKQAIFNQLVKQGSTNLLNFGKNTQWAGRQLMVGFTLPLATLGTVAAKTFMEMEAQVIKFKKVYGDLFTPNEERQQALEEIQELASAFTKYGVAASETVGLAAEAAAAGFSGLDLQRQVTQATRLSVLGQVDNAKALETTIALQNAFKISSDELSDSINFLNAVENQTVVSLDDVTTAIPKVAPVIKALGGDIKDMAFFMAAMKEGGINASEGANALKSGLASLINPTDKAARMLGEMGINIRGIVERNAGNISGLMTEFAFALDRLDPLNRSRAIEQLFGKFQFARVSTLFENIIRDGNQASRVLELSGASVEELAALAEQELGMTAESSMNKFLSAVEQLRIALVPIGEVFLKVVTPFVDKIAEIAEGFNKLPDGIKKAITVLVTVIGGLGPIVLMTFGLLANAFANSIKFVAMLRNGYLRLTGQSTILGNSTDYLTQEQLEAAAVASSLDQAHAKLTQRFTAEAVAVEQLRQAYVKALAAGNAFARMNPGMMKPGSPKKFAAGGFVGGSGSGDTVPAMLTPGEFVVKKEAAMRMLPFLEMLNQGKILGFNDGGLVPTYTNAVALLQSSTNQALKGAGVGAGDLAAEFKRGGAGINAPIVKAIAEAMGATNNRQVVSMIQNDPNLQKFANNISMGVADSVAKAGGQVTDAQLSKIYQDVTRKQAAKMGPVYKDATEKFFTELTTFEDPTIQRTRSSGRTMSIGRAKLFKDRVSYRGMNYAPAAGALGMSDTKGLVKAHMSERQMMDLNQLSKTGELSNQAKAAVARLKAGIVKTYQSVQNAVVQGVKEASQSKSPSRKAKQAGKNIADGAIQGIREGAKGARKAGQQVGGAYRDPVTGRFAKRPAGGAGTPSVAVPMKEFGNKLMGATFAISAISGSLSMFGGTVGEVSGMIMTMSNVMFGLVTTGQLLMNSQKVRAAAETAQSIFLKGKGGAAGIKGVMNGFKALLPTILNVAKGLVRFIPVIGAVVTALAVFKIFKDQKDNVEALGKAAHLTSEQIKGLGERFGQETRTADFGAQFTTAGGTGQAGRTTTKSLVEDDTFAKDYKAQIEAISGATKEQAEQTLQSLAIQLSSSGLETQAVESIINAIATLAGKTNLNLKFASVDFATEEGQAAMKALGEKSAKNLSDTFAKTLTVGQSIAGFFGLGDRKAQLLTSAGEYATLFESIKMGFESGEMSADQFNEQMDSIRTNLESLDPSVLAQLIPAIGEKLGIEDQLEGLASYEDQLLLIEAAAAGIYLDPEQIKLLKSAADTKDAKTLAEINKLRKDLAKNISKQAESQERLNEANAIEEEFNQLMADTNAQIDEEIKLIEDQNAAYDILIANKFTEAQATELAANANIASALAYAAQQDQINKTTAETDALIERLNVLLQMRGEAKVKTGGSGGGGGKKSDFAQAKENLIEQRKEAQNTMIAYAKLRDAGLSVADAFDAAQDPALAAAFATTKPGTKQWSELVGLLKQTKQQAKELEKLELAVKVQTDFEGFWSDMMSKANEYYDILEYGVERQFRDRIRKEEKIIEKAEREITALQRQIAEQERGIELDFTRPIEALQEESSDLSNDLAIIDQAAKAINEKFDAQVKALQDVKRLNQDITNQQKTQISLADALSQGDISQAAALMQTMRGQAAEASATSMEDALNAARQGQLAGLTGASGMTRDQIEQRQYEISQQIYNLEEQREAKQLAIRQIQDQIYFIETGRLQNAKDRLDALTRERDAQIEAIDKQREKWEDAQYAQNLARIKAGEFNDVLKIGKLLVGDIVSRWNSIKDRVVKLYIQEVRIPAGGSVPSGGGGGGGGSSSSSGSKSSGSTSKGVPASDKKGLPTNRRTTPIPSKSGGSAPKTVRISGVSVARGNTTYKKYARGGLVRGTGFGDRVPSLLTPGEFVVNKAASRRFMPMLKRLNETKFPGMLGGAQFATPSFNIDGGYTAFSPTENRQESTEVVSAPVYNYNLSVNVNGGRDMSANQIANVVMTRIKQMDSQRIRRQSING